MGDAVSDNPNGAAGVGYWQSGMQQGHACAICGAWVMHGINPHVCQLQPTVAVVGWRCTCMVFVVPGEEHRCFYRDILNVLERIATQLEKR